MRFMRGLLSLCNCGIVSVPRSDIHSCAIICQRYIVSHSVQFTIVTAVSSSCAQGSIRRWLVGCLVRRSFIEKSGIAYDYTTISNRRPFRGQVDLLPEIRFDPRPPPRPIFGLSPSLSLSVCVHFSVYFFELLNISFCTCFTLHSTSTSPRETVVEWCYTAALHACTLCP